VAGFLDNLIQSHWHGQNLRFPRPGFNPAPRINSREPQSYNDRAFARQSEQSAANWAALWFAN
jgi:hypothetical protein